MLPLLVLAIALGLEVAALSTAQLRERSIYQVITDRFARADGREDVFCDPAQRVYCGGGWKGIEKHLGYIQGMGFDTIWISPVVANIEGIPGSESYHGYWAANMWELNDNFGSAQDLMDLSNALHMRGMYLMVDVAVNHVGAVPGLFKPGPEYGAFTSPSHFHPFCMPDDWNDQHQVEQCWLTDHMADLNTESAEVVAFLHTWINQLVRDFRIDAIRVDTVKHVRKDFWPGFVRAGGVAAMGEVLHGDATYLLPYQEKSMSSLLDYATFYHLRRAFASTQAPIDELTSMITRVHHTMPDPTLLGSFLDNHDQPRFPSFVRDRALVKNAAVYPFINDGFPVIYQGQEHGLTGGDDPHNREAIWLHGFSTTSGLYQTFARLNHARRRAASFAPYLSSFQRHSKLDARTVALAKSPLVSILTNAGASAPPRVYYLPSSFTSYAPKLAVIDALTGQIFATDPNGGLPVTIIAGEPRVFLPLGLWEGRQHVAWQHLRQPESPLLASPGRKKGSGGSVSPGHSRQSSRSSLFGWLRGSK